MRKSNVAICIHDEIAAELRAIALDPAPREAFAAQHQARVLQPHFRLPCPHERAFQIVRAIRGTIWVKQECKTRARFGLPRARLVRRSKRNQDDARIHCLKCSRVLAQLCHMLTTRQSTQVPQENEKRILSLAHHPGK